jgi:glycosyltransferase involved in cell wall biosynthesis
VRILYLNHNVVGAGTYQRASSFAQQLAVRGHEVTLVTTSRTSRSSGMERNVSGVRIIEAPDLLSAGGRNGWDPWNTGWRVRRLRDERFDLIHAFDCRPAVIGPALVQQRRTGAPLFIDWADWWGRGGTIGERSGWLVRTMFGPVETWFEEAFRTDAAANTTISEPLRERCMQLGVQPERVRVLPNGCRTPFTVPGGRRAARRRCRGGEAPLIVHLGVMHAGDAAMLFDAFRVVQRVLPGAQLALLGAYRGRVPRDLEGDIRRTGYVNDADLADWLVAADLAVVPLSDTVANRARWPGKVNEYLSAGVPVVLPRVGAAAWWVEAAGAGVTCEPTAAALAGALIDTLQSPLARGRMSEAARALAAGALSWERIGSSLVDFYSAWAPTESAPAGQNGGSGVT